MFKVDWLKHKIKNIYIYDVILGKIYNENSGLDIYFDM